jgi:hypothetical protein
MMDVWTAEFIYNDGYNDTTYCGVIFPWLEEEWGDYCEGGYVVGETVQYTYKVEDIDHITFWREGAIDGPEETGSLERINPDTKRLWLSDLSQYMTDHADRFVEL